MNRIFALILGVIMTGLVALEAGGAIVEAQESAVLGNGGKACSITIAMKDSTISGERVFVNIVFKNAGTNDIVVENMYPFAGYEFEIENEKHEKVPLTLYGAYWMRHYHSDNPRSSSSSTVKSGADLAAKVPLNSLYDITLPGKYTISVRRHCAWNGKPPMMSVASNRISFSVEEPTQ